MNAAEIAQTLEVLGTLATVVDGLGIPGIVLLMLAGPLLMLCALYLLEYKRNKSTNAMITDIRADFQTALETYRADTQKISRELGTNQSRTDRYYRDNVELVKQYERIAKNLQDVVVSNTMAVTRLNTMLEDRRKMV
jgi:hypothetical protein